MVNSPWPNVYRILLRVSRTYFRKEWLSRKFTKQQTIQFRFRLKVYSPTQLNNYYVQWRLQVMKSKKNIKNTLYSQLIKSNNFSLFGSRRRRTLYAFTTPISRESTKDELERAAIANNCSIPIQTIQPA
jgi:hypothetical protein